MKGPLRHLLQVKPVRYILSCCHGNKITKGTSQNFAPKKSEKPVIFKDIELKFGIETKFGPLSSKRNINLQFDVIMTFSAFRSFRWWKHKNDVILTSYIKILKILKLKSKDNARQTLHAKFYVSRIKNKQIRRGVKYAPQGPECI